MPYRNRIAGSPSDRECPRCGEPLASDHIGKLSVERCLRCFGVWVSASEFNTLLVESDRQRHVLERETRHMSETHEETALLCPACSGELLHQNFGRISQVMVDTCRKHGIWFDAGELRRAIEFHNTRTAAPALTEPATPRAKKPEPLDLSPLVAAQPSAMERLLYALLDMLTSRRGHS
ncbi:MAG: zf-TFIIB domain-containing protein [Proteobacteria bacterium]|nr:zf-TFIIB domain-containing protein [Pseudomonadota bacterium]